MRIMNLKLKEMVLCGIFAALTAVMSQVSIPIPFSTVPVTLQTLAVLMAAALLGSKCGAVSQIIYILLGAAGVPVFANMKGSFAVLIGPTGGYILSFPLAALVAGIILEKAKKSSRLIMLGAMASGLVVLYTIGTLQLGFVMKLGFIKAVATGVIPFIPFEMIKLPIAAIFCYQARQYLTKAGVLLS
jgi:biotin transport system substrate-specific component